jgi:6-pyruvoyltetrahydropterin/6-carboxytetrahydropterin synthase
MYILKLKTNFSAAHQLTNAYDEKCNASIHGHDWKVLVEIKTEKLINNMVIDFKKIKEIINELDHKNLNEVLDFEPTAELITKYIYDKLVDFLPKNEKTEIIVTVWEADNASITYFK